MGNWPRPIGQKVNRYRLMLIKATFLNSEGEAEKAYQVLEQLRSIVASEDRFAASALGNLIYFQGVTALRRGENDNCIMCRGESSCILPISPAAVHTNPTGSRLAIKHFTEYLDQFPDDLEVRWLLNVAHMTLGEYPDKVDPRYRLNLDRFFHSEFDIGKFRDIGHLVGVNRFNQAGGAIMEDFDNDGLLDIVVTSFDSTQPMSYYRNKGDSTFEDRSQEAGVTDQSGEWFVTRPTTTMTVAWTSISPAGPGSPGRSGRRSYAITELAASPTSPRRPACWTRSIPTPRPGPITTTTAGSTCSSVRETVQAPLSQQGKRDLRGSRRQGGRAAANPHASARVAPGSTSTTTATPTCSSIT